MVMTMSLTSIYIILIKCNDNEREVQMKKNKTHLWNVGMTRPVQSDHKCPHPWLDVVQNQKNKTKKQSLS